jgi:hypothetical protein
MTTIDFENWLKGRAKTCIYFTGFLFAARNGGDPKTPEQRLADSLGRSVYRAYELGLVTLTQRRLGSGNYEYRAAKRSRPQFAVAV